MALKDAQAPDTMTDRHDPGLRRQLRMLTFSPGLERDYAEWSRRDHVIPALICAALALVIWLGFAGYDLVRLEVFARFPDLSGEAWTILIVRWSVALLLIGTLLSVRVLQNNLPLAAMVVYLAIGAGAALTSHLFHRLGLPRAEITQLIVVMAAFLPIGMGFYQALGAALLVVCITLVSAIAILAPEAQMEMGYLVVAMIIAVPVGAIGGYLREYSRRDGYLLRRTLSQQALFDPLTDLANRRMFERRAKKAMAHARRQGDTLTLVAIDVDFFKPYNDRYGHGAGDEVLIAIAGSLREASRRPLDIAARMGGEEFALVLYGADREDARDMLDALFADIARLDIAHEGSPVASRLTISAGAASFDGHESLESLYRRADALLYRSKLAGRNRITFDEPATPPTPFRRQAARR